MEENIIVSVRARPLNEREKQTGEYVAWLIDPTTKLVVSIPDPNIHLNFEDESSPFSKNDRQNRVHEFPFDHLFEQHVSTQEVHER